jgi:hypothetical protein
MFELLPRCGAGELDEIVDVDIQEITEGIVGCRMWKLLDDFIAHGLW